MWKSVLNKTKQFNISKQLVMHAWKLVKGNDGSAGVDQQSIADFERFKGKKARAGIFLSGMLEKQPTLFAHWRSGFSEGYT